MKGRLAGEKVQERCIVGLDYEEEDLFGRYAEKGGANYGV